MISDVIDYDWLLYGALSLVQARKASCYCSYYLALHSTVSTVKIQQEKKTVLYYYTDGTRVSNSLIFPFLVLGRPYGVAIIDRIKRPLVVHLVILCHTTWESFAFSSSIFFSVSLSRSLLYGFILLSSSVVVLRHTLFICVVWYETEWVWRR